MPTLQERAKEKIDAAMSELDEKLTEREKAGKLLPGYQFKVFRNRITVVNTEKLRKLADEERKQIAPSD